MILFTVYSDVQQGQTGLVRGGEKKAICQNASGHER